MKNRGFTLIELVMVIVIIGILAAVAIPRFVSLRKDAEQAACDGNLGAVRGALTAYYAKGAISPTWDSAGRNSVSGFPKDTSGSVFKSCFLMAGLLPTCPTAGSAVYKGATNYASTTGVMTRHIH